MIEALRRWLGRPRQPVIRSRQLLDWLEEASKGFWCSIAPTGCSISPCARLLGIGTEQVVKGRYLLEWCAATIEESVRKHARRWAPTGELDQQHREPHTTAS